MNQFGILIQKTTAGANIEYISSYLNTTHPDIISTNYDERKEVTQIANGTNVYSIQTTNSYRVYSLIITDVVDNMGRLGYIAFRIYAPFNSIITNFVEVLDQLFEQYTLKSASKTIASLNEDLIFTNINSRTVNSSIVALPDDHVYFFYYENNNSELLNTFNSSCSSVVKKIYAFDKKVPEPIIRNFRFESIYKILNSFRVVQINNPYRILRDLKINDLHLFFDPNKDRLEVYCKQNDQIYYSTTDHKKDRLVFGNSLFVERQVVTQPPPGGGSASFNFLDKYGTALILSCMAILISGIIWFFIRDNNYDSLPQSETEVTNPESGGGDEATPFNIGIEIFKVDNRSCTFYRFNTNPETCFVFDKNEWKFGDTSLQINKYKVFNKSNFTENNFLDYKRILDSIHIIIPKKDNSPKPDKEKSNENLDNNRTNRQTQKNKRPSSNNSNSNSNNNNTGDRRSFDQERDEKFLDKNKSNKDSRERGGTNLP
jgi:hypothetical protein